MNNHYKRTSRISCVILTKQMLKRQAKQEAVLPNRDTGKIFVLANLPQQVSL